MDIFAGNLLVVPLFLGPSCHLKQTQILAILVLNRSIPARQSKIFHLPFVRLPHLVDLLARCGVCPRNASGDWLKMKE